MLTKNNHKVLTFSQLQATLSFAVLSSAPTSHKVFRRTVRNSDEFARLTRLESGNRKVMRNDKNCFVNDGLGQ